jgi:hypothetical protein
MRHFVSLFLRHKTPFRAAILIHISFRIHDIRYGKPLFGEQKTIVAHVHWKTPGNFCRCSLHPGKPFLRHPTCPSWLFSQLPEVLHAFDEVSCRRRSTQPHDDSDRCVGGAGKRADFCFADRACDSRKAV